MSHMKIFDDICSDLGMGKDPHEEAAEWCIAEFHRLWKLNETTQMYTKVCRVFFLPVANGSLTSSTYWGHRGHYDNYFALNNEDSRILAPLDLDPCVMSDGADKRIGHGNTDFMRKVSSTLGVDPQRLNFTEMIRDGVEIEMVLSKKDVDNGIKCMSTGYSGETINSLMSKEGWLGSYARHGETKPITCFLMWAVFGVKISTSLKLEEINTAIEKSVCPPIKAIDVERARYIRSQIEAILGRRGRNVRGLSTEGVEQLIARFDDSLVSIGVAPVVRKDKWKTFIALK